MHHRKLLSHFPFHELTFREITFTPTMFLINKKKTHFQRAMSECGVKCYFWKLECIINHATAASRECNY